MSMNYCLNSCSYNISMMLKSILVRKHNEMLGIVHCFKMLHDFLKLCRIGVPVVKKCTIFHNVHV